MYIPLQRSVRFHIHEVVSNNALRMIEKKTYRAIVAEGMTLTYIRSIYSVCDLDERASGKEIEKLKGSTIE